jgi:hypothetical protein
VWLLGDTRVIREDARVYFRKANLPEPSKDDGEWKDKSCSLWDTSDLEPEEGDYARVLELINEFLPVSELAGRLISVAELKQFGLVENESVDRYLAQIFRREEMTIVPEAASSRLPKAEPSSTIDFSI